MKIVSVAFPLLPTEPDAGGGAEQILHILERGLVEQGHESVVIAAEGSEVSGELFAGPAANGEISDALRRQAHCKHRELIQEVLSTRCIDLVHFHGLDFFSYFPSSRHSAKVLATLHLPVDWYPAEIFNIPELYLNCVSRSQAHTVAGRELPVIGNGVEVYRYRCKPSPRDGLLLLARICPEKGVDIGLRVAHKLGSRLLVAGPVHPFPAHQQYFKKKVEPLLDRERVYAGAVGLKEKIKLLTTVRCLLIPSLAAETSSLVAMEAAAAGTPVVAFRSGALQEVIKDGKTGFIVGNEDEMAAAVCRSDTISSEVCQEHARTWFDSKRMIRDYVDLYSRIIDP